MIQFDPSADPAAGRFAGRAEHVASGRAIRFASAEELTAFVARVLVETSESTNDPGA